MTKNQKYFWRFKPQTENICWVNICWKTNVESTNVRWFAGAQIIYGKAGSVEQMLIMNKCWKISFDHRKRFNICFHLTQLLLKKYIMFNKSWFNICPKSPQTVKLLFRYFLKFPVSWSSRWTKTDLIKVASVWHLMKRWMMILTRRRLLVLKPGSGYLVSFFDHLCFFFPGVYGDSTFCSIFHSTFVELEFNKKLSRLRWL